MALAMIPHVNGYTPANFTYVSVVRGNVMWQNCVLALGLVAKVPLDHVTPAATSGCDFAISHVSATVRPVLTPPLSVAPLANRAFSVTSTPLYTCVTCP